VGGMWSKGGIGAVCGLKYVKCKDKLKETEKHITPPIPPLGGVKG
jgi:hypothetical protein